MTQPLLIVLAGPNGAGNTTFARYNLRPFIDAGTFLNADEVAHASRPDDGGGVAMGAARKMLDERRAELQARLSFCVETTLATHSLRRFVVGARAEGYASRLVFLFTPDSQLNEFRVNSA